MSSARQAKALAEAERHEAVADAAHCRAQAATDRVDATHGVSAEAQSCKDAFFAMLHAGDDAGTEEQQAKYNVSGLLPFTSLVHAHMLCTCVHADT